MENTEATRKPQKYTKAELCWQASKHRAVTQKPLPYNRENTGSTSKPQKYTKAELPDKWNNSPPKKRRGLRSIKYRIHAYFMSILYPVLIRFFFLYFTSKNFFRENDRSQVKCLYERWCAFVKMHKKKCLCERWCAFVKMNKINK